MRLKAISELPILPAGKTGDSAAVQMLDGTIVLDCYKNDRYLGRYCSDGEKEYKFREASGEKWKQMKLLAVYEYGWWESSQPRNLRFASKEQGDAARKFADERETYRDTFAGKIEKIEYEIGKNRKERAYDSKCRRIAAMMDKVPKLPEDWDAWCSETIFGGKEYMFYDDVLDAYRCTACGKLHRKKGAKHNEITVCSRTGKQVQIKKRQKSVSAMDHAMLLQEIDDTLSVSRHLKVECVWSGAVRRIHTYENVRMMLPRADEHPKWCTRIFYGQKDDATPEDQWWFDSNPRNKRARICYCYPNTVNAALSRTAYDAKLVLYVAWEGWALNYNNLMWSDEPFFEYLAKGRFRRLLKEACTSVSWGHYYGTLNRNGENAAEVLGISAQRVNRLRDADGGMVYLHWMRYEEKNGERIPEDAVRWLSDRGLYENELHFMLVRMSVTKAVNYLRRQQKLHGGNMQNVLRTYHDYLSMAINQKMNLDEDMIFRPKDLKAAHDALIERMNRKNREKRQREMNRKYPGVTKVLKTLSMYEYGNDKYCVIAPRSVLDIMDEGAKLNHCVGTSERYFDRIAQRESYILFLRRANKPDAPYYTLEVEPGGVIRQKRTTGDKQTPDIKQATEFLREWQAVISERVTDEQKKLQKKSAKLRADEFEQLRKDGNRVNRGVLAGQLLVDVLEKDLMEIENIA